MVIILYMYESIGSTEVGIYVHCTFWPFLVCLICIYMRGQLGLHSYIGEGDNTHACYICVYIIYVCTSHTLHTSDAHTYCVL